MVDEKTDPMIREKDSDTNAAIVALEESATALHFRATIWQRVPLVSVFIRRLALRLERRAERLRRRT